MNAIAIYGGLLGVVIVLILVVILIAVLRAR